MTTYILLRQNKESAPLSFEDIQRSGLKPDDLVWVEGQSVCWLKPAEIRELKALVGKTEENLADSALKYQPVTAATQSAGEEITEKKRVFVAMPNGTVPAPGMKKEPVKDGNTEETPMLTQPVPLAKKEETVAKIKYVQPLDEIKEMYVKRLQQRKQSRGFSISLPPQAKKIAIYAGLVIAGIITGIIIKNAGAKKNNLAKENIQPVTEPKSNPVTNIPENTEPVVTNETAITNTPRLTENVDQIKQTEKRNPETIQPTLPTGTRNKSPEQTSDERSVVTKEEETKKTTPANDISSLVSVKSNDYIVASFGGIRNLELTVKNDSKYTLDQVAVELTYLKPRDELLKTETINFHSVPPNASLTLPVKKSNRGVKVVAKIIRIESKEMGTSTAGL